MNFPHLNDNQSFPDLPGDLYQGQPTFDYRLWSANTRIKVCQVPWDASYSDVVYFESIAERDAYLNSVTGLSYQFDSAFHLLPMGTGNSVKLPIPAQAIQNFNYVVIDLPAPPVDYTDFVRNRFCFFLTDVEQEAPSTSSCTVVLDVWTTFINDVKFDYMLLERGHWPVSQTDVDGYLANPLDNNMYLCAPDVNFGDLAQVKTQAAKVLNDDCYCCFVANVNWATSTSWGTVSDLTATVPNTGIPFQSGAPASYMFVCDADSAATVAGAIENQVPWALQTLQAIAFIDKDLIAVGSSFAFCGQTLHRATRATKTFDLVTLDKSQFGYDAAYSDLAKLYTYPYAAIELTDARGTDRVIRIEDTTGKLQLETLPNTIFPYLKIRGNLIGVGSPTVSQLSYEGAGTYSSKISGLYYRYFWQWDVPTFAVAQPMSVQNSYGTVYDREQAKVAYTNAFTSATASNATANTNAKASNATANTNAKASNATANTNAKASNNTAKANADNSANTLVTNNAVNVSATSTTTARTIQANTNSNSVNNTAIGTQANGANNMSSANYAADQAGLAVALSNAQSQSTDTQNMGLLSAAGSVISGDIGGFMGSLAGVMMTGNNLTRTEASIGVSQSNSTTIYNATRVNTSTNASNARTYATQLTNIGNNALSANTATTNSASNSVAANNSNLAKTNANNTRTTGNANADRAKSTGDANADRAKSTGDANADRTKTTGDANASRTRNTAIEAVSNQVRQRALQAPVQFGFANAGSEIMTNPIVMVANIITQSKSAIAQAGTQFLRYGYYLNQQIKFTTFNVMNHFSYWKLNDVWWLTESPIDGRSQDTIRAILTSGVTVWNDPSEIGAVSIYDN